MEGKNVTDKVRKRILKLKALNEEIVSTNEIRFAEIAQKIENHSPNAFIPSPQNQLQSKKILKASAFSQDHSKSPDSTSREDTSPSSRGKLPKSVFLPRPTRKKLSPIKDPYPERINTEDSTLSNNSPSKGTKKSLLNLFNNTSVQFNNSP